MKLGLSQPITASLHHCGGGGGGYININKQIYTAASHILYYLSVFQIQIDRKEWLSCMNINKSIASKSSGVSVKIEVKSRMSFLCSMKYEIMVSLFSIYNL